MKKLLSILLLAITTKMAFADEPKYMNSVSLINETYRGVFIEMPDYREINSGSKFIVTYEGDWPAEMEGAFEYAIKIWEEVLPMTLPINITAKIGSIRNPAGALSTAQSLYCDYYGMGVNDFSSHSTMVKSVCLQQYHSGRIERYFDEISDTSIFSSKDIIITYNSAYLEEFDFSLDGVPNLDKYDFVTVALRDIAIGLGFITNITANTSNKEIEFTNERYCPFEKIIIKSLGTLNPYTAFVKATNGSLDLNIQNLKLYAPNPWDNKVSLKYFIPGSHPLSKLLTYDFGKGYIMRDLSNGNWENLFGETLEWREYIGVSSNDVFNATHSEGTSKNILPYKGQISINFNSKQRGVINNDYSTTKSELPTSILNNTIPGEYADIINQYCEKYDMFSPDGPQPDGLSISALKKDGTWDCLLKTSYNPNIPLTIKIEDLVLHFSDSEYARGTGGGLKYRITFCEKVNNGPRDYYSYQTKYFTRDYLPQKPKIKYTKALSNPYKINGDITTYNSEDNDYYVDVKVGISNVEGTKKLIVEQLDEGETLPFQYEVEEADFRKGYFIANLDRECSTQLTVISYNDNGYQRSNTITIPAIGYPKESLSFTFFQRNIYIHGLYKSSLSSGEYSYTCQKVNSMFRPYPKVLHSSILPVSSTISGIYVLTIYKNGEDIGSFKFQI